MLKNKKILVAPLNWGLGHASRCIPLIDRLKRQGNSIAIASDGIALELLKKNYPSIQTFTLPSYDITYKYASMELNMLLQGPKILSVARQEEKAMKTIVEVWKPDLIISDNRFGVRHRSCKSIFLTHQLQVLGKNKLFSRIATWLHTSMIKKFDECWVPDYEGKDALAGAMSQAQLSIPVIYLGPLSRIQKKPTFPTLDILVVLSGPEPQRTILEDLLLQELKTLCHLNIHIVRGITGGISIPCSCTNIGCSDIAESKELNELLNSARLIICRSGYSSMMDLAVLDTPAILIPTPGQYEQEYLAQQADRQNRYTAVAQSEIDRLIPSIENYIGKGSGKSA